MKISWTKEKFIEESIKKHGIKYDYSKVQYTRSKDKVIIICPIHGEFKQEAHGHVRGFGCKKCYFESQISSKDAFIKKAVSVHGDLYDYSETNYENSYSSVTIICKKHGKYQQTAKNHLSGRGCDRCAIELDTKTQSKFIEECKSLHGDKYNYDKVEYICRNKKVIIICKKHGDFLQKPSSHLCGCGCPKCNKIILNDGTACDSQVEAYRYLCHKESGIPFIHNKRYGYSKESGRMRYDFYFPSLKLYEEVTSFNLSRKTDNSWINAKTKNKYIENIERKRKLVKSMNCEFRFIDMQLRKYQREYVLKNTQEYK